MMVDRTAKRAVTGAIAEEEYKEQKTQMINYENDKFAKDFMCWLMGKDPTERTDPAYIKRRLQKEGINPNHGPLRGEGVDEFLTSFLEKRAEFIHKFTRIKLGPNKAMKWNLGHYYLYYKYVLRDLPYPEDEIFDDFSVYFPLGSAPRPDKSYKTLSGEKLKYGGRGELKPEYFCMLPELHMTDQKEPAAAPDPPLAVKTTKIVAPPEPKVEPNPQAPPEVSPPAKALASSTQVAASQVAHAAPAPIQAPPPQNDWAASDEERAKYGLGPIDRKIIKEEDEEDDPGDRYPMPPEDSEEAKRDLNRAMRGLPPKKKDDKGKGPMKSETDPESEPPASAAASSSPPPVPPRSNFPTPPPIKQEPVASANPEASATAFAARPEDDPEAGSAQPAAPAPAPKKHVLNKDQTESLNDINLYKTFYSPQRIKLDNDIEHIESVMEKQIYPYVKRLRAMLLDDTIRKSADFDSVQQASDQAEQIYTNLLNQHESLLKQRMADRAKQGQSSVAQTAPPAPPEFVPPPPAPEEPPAAPEPAPDKGKEPAHPPVAPSEPEIVPLPEPEPAKPAAPEPAKPTPPKPHKYTPHPAVPPPPVPGDKKMYGSNRKIKPKDPPTPPTSPRLRQLPAPPSSEPEPAPAAAAAPAPEAPVAPAASEPEPPAASVSSAPAPPPQEPEPQAQAEPPPAEPSAAAPIPPDDIPESVAADQPGPSSNDKGKEPLKPKTKIKKREPLETAKGKMREKIKKTEQDDINMEYGERIKADREYAAKRHAEQEAEDKKRITELKRKIEDSELPKSSKKKKPSYEEIAERAEQRIRTFKHINLEMVSRYDKSAPFYLQHLTESVAELGGAYAEGRPGTPERRARKMRKAQQLLARWIEHFTPPLAESAPEEPAAAPVPSTPPLPPMSPKREPSPPPRAATPPLPPVSPERERPPPSDEVLSSAPPPPASPRQPPSSPGRRPSLSPSRASSIDNGGTPIEPLKIRRTWNKERKVAEAIRYFKRLETPSKHGLARPTKENYEKFVKGLNKLILEYPNHNNLKVIMEKAAETIAKWGKEVEREGSRKPGRTRSNTQFQQKN
jgi:hypothetical protein